MRKLLTAATLAIAMTSFNLSAQDTGIEIPSLADVMTDMDSSEIAEMESSVGDVGALGADFDVAVDVAVEAAVSEAIEEGLISASEASDAAATLTLVSDNAQFFNFDILDAIGSVVESGEFSIAEVRSTLEGFNNLSDAGKTVVGNEEFDYISAVTNYDAAAVAAETEEGLHMAASKARWDSLSGADQNVVLTQMTLLTVCRGDDC